MKTETLGKDVEQAKAAALEVLRNNSRGPFMGLPRTAAWGYPEPYTRDLMIAALGILVSDDNDLSESLREVMQTLAANRTAHGHIPSLVHDPHDLGASDTTPLFLLGAAICRIAWNEPDFLKEAVDEAVNWMHYQSPDDCIMVTQQPTSDWRDEQWVLGYGLYVNSLVYAYMCLLGMDKNARILKKTMHRFDVRKNGRQRQCSRGYGY